MLSSFAKRLSCFFVPNASPEDRKVYSYSFEILLSTIANLVALCFIAVVTHTFRETVFFMMGSRCGLRRCFSRRRLGIRGVA